MMIENNDKNFFIEHIDLYYNNSHIKTWFVYTNKSEEAELEGHQI